MTEYGPQVSRDDALTARMRFHQSWWRVHHLHQSECGTDDRGRPYGNYLTEEAAADGQNFLTDEIFGVALERMAAGPGVERFRCTRNLLSSQPMAFNLFAPLCSHPELASAVLDRLLPGGVSRAEVLVEWAPHDKAAHLNDATSFDVVVRYQTAAGQPAIAAIETKLTEPFSQKHYDADRYREVARRSTVWKNPNAEELAQTEWNQLWRNHLLVESIRQQPGNEDLLGCEILVHHPNDTRCVEALAGYSALVDEKGSVFALDLSRIIEAWRCVTGDDFLEWFTARYLNLSLSQDAWEEFGAPVNTASSAAGETPAVTAGHRKSVALLQDAVAVETTLELYCESGLVAGVYLRPTDAGLVVISLDDSCPSMIGVGKAGTRQHVLSKLPPTEATVRTASHGYVEKKAKLGRESKEEQFALRCIRYALTNGMRLPGHEDIYFLHQEWRLPRLGKAAKIDLLGVDPAARQLVVIECKDSENTAIHGDGRPLHAAAQAQSYADEVTKEQEILYPFFAELGAALTRTYGGPMELADLVLDPALAPRTLVWWPGHPIP